jgi:DNA-binding LytR/AlgR family response regulator
MHLQFFSERNPIDTKQILPMERTAKNFFFRVKDHLEQIDVNDILYLEADINYTIFKTLNRRFVSSFTLKVFQEELSCNQFLRVNRGLLVNMCALINTDSDISNNYLELKNGERLKISRRRKLEVENRLIAFKSLKINN